MKIATFNVNGINGRLIGLRWLAEAAPDVVCLQEAPQERFPAAALRDAGYGAIWQRARLGTVAGCAIGNFVRLGDWQKMFTDGHGNAPTSRAHALAGARGEAASRNRAASLRARLA